MPYDLRIIRSREFVRLDADGHFDLAATHRLFADLLWACTNSKIGRLLLDLRDATSELTSSQLCALAKISRDVSPPPDEHKIAILGRPEVQFDRIQFVAGMAQGQGWNIAVFTEFEQAFEWVIV
jgi:hypothetical protein